MDRSGDLLPGTFEMLVLKAVSLGDMHGWGIAERIERLSGGVCGVQQGTVYPVLQRLLRRGWVIADWRVSDNQRRARYYRLTAAGRRALGQELDSWKRFTTGLDAVLRST